MKNQKLNKLAIERSNPCVTISMNTHRTHPDNANDIIGLKNLLSEAKNRVIKEFGKRDASELLIKIDALGEEIDSNHNLDSLHIFISNSTKEIIRSPLPTQKDTVNVSNSFAIKPLIKVINQTVEYYILLLSQSGVKLLLAINDKIIEEIINDDFPFTENPHSIDNKEKLSDGKKVDNMLGEYFNEVDKALVKVSNHSGLNCLVICTDNNYSRLMHVADKPSIYYGYAKINYNDITDKNLASQAWEIVKGIHYEIKEKAIAEMQEAVGYGKVLTNVSEIYQAAKEGRGDLLIVHNDYVQSVKMTGEFTLDIVNDLSKEEAIDDIISEIAWEVISKDGRAFFVNQENIKTLGDITLKIRY